LDGLEGNGDIAGGTMKKKTGILVGNFLTLQATVASALVVSWSPRRISTTNQNERRMIAFKNFKKKEEKKKIAIMMKGADQSKLEIHRQFRFVAPSQDKDGGGGFPSGTDGKLSISCDGLVAGATFHVSHWAGNQTPENLYADTSTEMALLLARTSNADYATLNDAWVLNNHYDTDGVLSVWACLEPDQALVYSKLLIQGAEAGDFGEWSSDLGVKLDCALAQIGITCGIDNEGRAFDRVLFQDDSQWLPNLLHDLQSTGGETHAHLWRPEWDRAWASWQLFQENQVILEHFNDDIVIMTRPLLFQPLSPYAVHRALKEQGLDRSIKRILHVFTTTDKEEEEKEGSARFFKYEKVGHGWVQKLVQRPSVPSVNSSKLVQDLNATFKSANWKQGGDGLVSICQSMNSISTPVHQVAEFLATHDDGLH
jgi:hypothetical protein